MATRRPAKSTPIPPNAQLSKRRQANAKTTVPVRPTDEAQHPSQHEQNNGTQGLTKSSNTQEDFEANIRVVIRCRRRSEREVQDNSPIIVSSAGAKSKELIIEVGAPVSSLGIVQLPPTRKYNFDVVFGPEADQAMIYHDVVQPMLEEVLLGYNCTLFAYGQTGTGKTYTMQGDLTPTPMGNPSPSAGMIPRVIFRLFHELEKSGVDFSVKISFVELYNEELRDLLASELPPPSGAIQPMGAGVKDNIKNQDAALKIFDDANKKGVIIQGLEEIAVKDSRDALALLTKGSHRRQIAATKFNDHSSRSHSVFSITVHTKETSSIGDDLLRVGKLNLVDLAGSENIGRSGAENKRAREAGMINQSLLTLGRVINALVDRAQHVPYRESKLTRLLQDSLGGHTKTCIVATISPARSNMEETLSTLDYALRAKSIRNKPELNQRMSRNALLKEYIAEIERLKADIMATREKNGIYFSEDNWKQICDEQELQATELAEAKKQIEIVGKELGSVREEYDQSIAALKCREKEIQKTRATLAEKEDQLARTETELKDVRTTLEEEIIIRKAHQRTEAGLNDVALGLKKVAKDSLQDVSDLFSKIARKQTVLSENSQAVATYRKTISTSTDSLTQRLNAFIRSTSEHSRRTHEETKQFEAKQLELLAARSKQTEKQLERLAETVSTIQSKDNVESDALHDIQSTLHETVASLRAESVARNEQWSQTFQQQRQALEVINKKGFLTLEDSLKALSILMEAMSKEALHFVEAQESLMQRAKSLADNTSSGEIQRLRKQNQVLNQLLDNEKVKAQKAQNDLLQRISGLLGDYTNERDRSLRQAISPVSDDNNRAIDKLSTFAANHAEVIDGSHEKAAEVSSSLRDKSKECKRTRDIAFKSLGEVRQGVSSNFEAIRATTVEAMELYSGSIQRHTQNMQSACTTSFEGHARAKRARLDTTSALTTEIQTEHHDLLQGLDSMSRQHKDVSDKISADSTRLTDLALAYRKEALTQLGITRTATETLVEQGARADVPTGSTPRKRAWELVEQWELTKDRDEILKTWREELTGSENGATPRSTPSEDSANVDEDTEVTERHVKSPTPDLIMSSGSPASLMSSLSSTSSGPIMHPFPSKKGRLAGALPRKLPESKNAYTTHNSRRK